MRGSIDVKQLAANCRAGIRYRDLPLGQSMHPSLARANDLSYRNLRPWIVATSPWCVRRISMPSNCCRVSRILADLGVLGIDGGPVGGVGRCLLQRLHDDALNVVIVIDRERQVGLVVQAVQPIGGEALTPLATVAGVTLNSAAMSPLVRSSSAQANTIRHRSASACELFGRRPTAQACRAPRRQHHVARRSPTSRHHCLPSLLMMGETREGGQKFLFQEESPTQDTRTWQ